MNGRPDMTTPTRRPVSAEETTRILLAVDPPEPSVTRETPALRRSRRAWWWAAALATTAVAGLAAGWVAQTGAAGGCW